MGTTMDHLAETASVLRELKGQIDLIEKGELIENTLKLRDLSSEPSNINRIEFSFLRILGVRMRRSFKAIS